MPLRIELREHASFTRLDNGQWRSCISQLDLVGEGATEAEAFEALRAAMREKMADKEFKRQLLEFVESRGAATTTEEYHRSVMRSVDRDDEPSPGDGKSPG